MKWYPPQTIRHVYWIPTMQKNRDLLYKYFPRATHFTLSKHYNDPVGKIPRGMLQINWGRTFNQPLPPLPPLITHLTFGDYFKQHISSFPPALTHLVLGICFGKPLPDLPPTITHITLTNRWNSTPLPSYPLPNLQYLNVQETSFNQPISGDLYPQLTHLLLPRDFSISTLPPLLTYLYVGSRFNQPINDLPKSLTHLVFPFICNFNKPINKLPPSLTHLILGSNFNHPADSLPSTLTHLYFGNAFNCPIDALPLSLTHLVLGHNFRQAATHTLPPILTHLSCTHFVIPPEHIPPKLTHLSTGDLPFSFDHLPHSLTHLALGGRDLHPTNYTVPLPAHIIYLSLPPSVKIPPVTISTVRIEYTGETIFWNPRPPV
eukprot:Phypoly_transcript_05816.p1 GENE.Phypoly_transcript_05816~~Phypoly_transcript_05816.p1  ORF type:complete len:375 (+),score=57.92 Phypoly_transcript_05816:484-1608(+)